MKKVCALTMVGMIVSSICSAMENDEKVCPLCTMTREMTVSYPPSQLAGRTTITQKWPTVWYKEICAAELNNSNGLILCQKLRCKSLKNNFFVHAAGNTAVVRKTDDVAVRSCDPASEAVDESDPTFVACCQPDQEGRFSQLDVHDGCLVCETMQPVIVHDEQVTPGATIPVVKKYGAPCENSGVIELKKVFVLVAAEAYAHKNY